MQRISAHAICLARLLIAIALVLNAIGVIDQAIPAKEMVERGVTASIVPRFMLAFLIPPTLISHSFWLSTGTPALMAQPTNFSKTVAVCGGILFINATVSQTPPTGHEKP